MDRKGPGLGFFVGKPQHQRLDVAIEDDADEFAIPVHHWAARVPTDDVMGGDEVERSIRMEGATFLLPAFRQIKRRAILHLGGTLEDSAQRRRCRDGLTQRSIPLHYPVGETQGERGVRILPLAFQSKAG